MTEPLFLRNDDYLGDFAARKIEVQAAVRLADRDGVLVSITPAIQDMPGGPLAHAILVPRSRYESAEDLRRGTLPGPMSVLVCRIKQGVDPSKSEYARADVSIALWGRVEHKKARTRRH